MKVDKRLGFALVALLVVVAGVGLSAIAFDPGEQDVGNPSATDETNQEVSPDEVPADVQQSLDGARQMKQELRNTDSFSEANVSIRRNGDVTVFYTSNVNSGPELKEEMGEVAYIYSDVVGEYNETGELTVATNGVKLLVSSDAAEAHADGKINEDAFSKTFHWGSVGQGGEN